MLGAVLSQLSPELTRTPGSGKLHSADDVQIVGFHFWAALSLQMIVY